jgi:3-hydroxybutyrate dehydrogenase
LGNHTDTLKGRGAIVTGSTSGIGLGIAQALAGQGASVLLNGFGEPEAIHKLVQGIGKRHQVKVVFSGADISKVDEVQEMVRYAEKALGSVDILVNNAGIQHVDAIEKFPAERWDAVIAINLSSNFHAIRAVLPQMRKRGWGRIINIASAHGLVASPGKAAYVAAKHGVIGLTKVVALETAESAITCNAICPGWVLTPLVEKQIEGNAKRDRISLGEAKERLLAEKQPSKEFATPEQVGALALFLCSESASQIRGAALPIDGGWTAQ